MSLLDVFKSFSSKRINVTCPECALVSEQDSAKVRKNITLVCPRCGTFFILKIINSIGRLD
ncbi:zinc-ribbon domain-containing protein [Yersinia pestis subsp. pestis]|uniref:YnfU family zinc-binding protein n=1 Tax=Yersinia pestis TaxID=632 RepID=UPI0013CCA464|nr:YnfU family zinc-binding protein [Yersinia pestis]MCF2953642.1 zinc-ribbon domain-containing protein [Yersinia pestis subsp. pestis]MCF2961188.1 zinc-ribbon domain-containing protein [Yersinia pestis subsp. pestis]MCV6831820.1 zinc-ribbon domain-containing protein [Yersinia pestis subsp. pestis]MCV6862917.1 zinc-ribbon domain-containing protein [Yersinia pestis subsp. pestis]MCV6877989.1 zinc-ribbon domain-containing protein [Yersinia pestis subsp. pestis]